jgi:hypothetical protein
LWWHACLGAVAARVDAFAEKIERMGDRSRGRIRADAAHQRLVAMR